MSTAKLNFLEHLELKNNRSCTKYLVLLKNNLNEFRKFLFFLIVFYSNKYSKKLICNN